MRVVELIFTVVADNGPVVVFLGFIPAMILLGWTSRVASTLSSRPAWDAFRDWLRDSPRSLATSWHSSACTASAASP
jgi:hypothetical protein